MLQVQSGRMLQAAFLAAGLLVMMAAGGCKKNDETAYDPRIDGVRMSQISPEPGILDSQNNRKPLPNVTTLVHTPASGGTTGPAAGGGVETAPAGGGGGGAATQVPEAPPLLTPPDAEQ